jgi:hypothetical protein
MKEGAGDRQMSESDSPPPGPWARRLQRTRCWAGLHDGRWEYRTRSACDQVLVCPHHGSTRSRTHHRWTRTNETFDEDLDNVDEVFQELNDKKSGPEHYRCRRCSEKRTEIDPESYR